VWGMDCGGADCDNIVCGMTDLVDNIVWGTAAEGDNIVWGMSGLDNIVWGMSGDATASWGSDAGADGNVVFPDASSEPVPDVGSEFGDIVPLPVVTPVVTPVVALPLGGGL
jgi:hypothetical protein